MSKIKKRTDNTMSKIKKDRKHNVKNKKGQITQCQK